MAANFSYFQIIYIYIIVSLSLYMYSDIIIIHLVLSIQFCMYTYFGR